MRVSARRPSPVRLLLRRLEQWFLGRDASAPIFRFVIVWGVFAAYWIGLVAAAAFTAPALPGWLNRLPFPFDSMVRTASMFFTPRVLAPLLPVAAALWLGLRLAAAYLSDLFELEMPSTASRYLWSSLFGLDYLSYPRLQVSTGDMEALDHDHPALAIGGPGYLRIHLGYAAVTETLDGRPRVYGPTPFQFIEGFERLRDVVDLRDQTTRMDSIRAMTRDGIEVLARDARMVFRVYRGSRRSRNLKDPYPYDEASVLKLVYGQPVTENARQPWVETLAGRMRREIQRFVERLSLEEFLALRPQPNSAEAPQTFAIPREELTARFHTAEQTSRLHAQGLELDWVGVGTWEVRDPASASATATGVSQTLIDAWREKERLDLYASPSYLERQHLRGYRERATSLLAEIVEIWRGDGQGQDTQALCLQLLSRIQGQLRRMRDELASDPEAHLPVDFDAAMRHLASMTAPHWLGGDA
jgi:hypothetical protein